ncbi:MAG: hemopexin repeat-containing protein [Cellulomonas sp.]
MGTSVWMFSGDRTIRYDRGTDAADAGRTGPTAAEWHGFTEAGFADSVDAAINWQNGRIYFFRGDQYLRYDLEPDRVADGYPRPIAGNWPGLAEAGFTTIDAAMNWGNGKAYFFRGDQYVRYDVTADKVDPGYPRPIAGNWPGLAEAGFDGVDSAIAWGNGKAYFFRGPLYARYDVLDGSVDLGYPLPIAAQWAGLGAAGFGGPLKAVVDTYSMGEVWLPGAEVRPATVAGPAYVPMPWRGVLHTTEGTTLDGALGTLDAKRSWPTLTIEPLTGRIVQHYSLATGARALRSATADLVKNAARAVQIEIVGKAAETPGWAPAQLDMIRGVLRSIEALVPIPQASGRTFLDSAGVNQTPGNRMSVDEWKRFSGWCGHQHVPAETHWDPGGIDIATLLT